MKKIARVFIDGTWNTPKDNSNIHRMYKTFGGNYYPGPGTPILKNSWRTVAFINKYLGGIFGFGVDKIVDQAYEDIGDAEIIYIFGFSRGSAAARMLAAKIGDSGRSVKFLGCFDTVGAFGIPMDILGIPFQKINLFHDMHVHLKVEVAAHAVALDEKRPAFVGTPMEPREGVTEKGFHGDHWYVGSSDETLEWMVNQYLLT